MNPVIEAIATRVSCSRLCEPAPDSETLKRLFEASIRVPDHMHLRPWRFLSVQGEALHKLGALFAKAAKLNTPSLSEEELQQKADKALRAPLIIVGICNYDEHEKVPEIEQQISTGCILHNLGLGLRSLGFASVWRTGDFAFEEHIKTGLGLSSQESIVGYLYVGSAEGKEKTLKPLDVDNYLSDWGK
jgi:nitroreductase